MNPTNLAKAIVHWLEFERLCERGKLITESSLKIPIHNYLSATTSTELKVEEPIQGLGTNTGKKKALDFVLKRPSGQEAYQHVIESKYVTDKRRFLQEIFKDLFRLDWITKPGQTEPFDRWLLLAGTTNHLQSQVFDVEINPGDGAQRSPAFGTILSKNLQTPANAIRVADAPARLRELWADAARELGQTQLPSSLRVTLKAAEPSNPVPQSFVCYIWQVAHQQNRTYSPI